MRRFLVATTIGLLWTAIFALSLLAQTGPGDSPSSPSFTIPPFEPPAGTVITVTTFLDNLTDNGDCTLREAIQAANTDAAVDACPAGNGDDLILLPAGIYGLSLAGLNEDGNATGDLDIFSSLVISGGGSAETIIDANSIIDRVLHILTGTVEIRSVTIQNGREFIGGGGVYNAGNAWFFDTVVADNIGGGRWSGGGILNVGKIVLDRCAIHDNAVTKGGYGGGLRNYGTAFLLNTTVSGNRSGVGADISGWALPGGDGGGISNSGNLLLQNTTIAYNQTRGYCFDPTDCSPGLGGSGGGLANNGGAVTIHNSLIAQNGVAAGGSGPDCTGIVSSQGPNFVGIADGCTLAGAGDDILNQHAFLGPLMDNPSSGSGQAAATPTHALLPYSPALDAGSCTDIGGAPILTDQRGEPRPQGAGCDLGAFESELSTIPLPERLHLPLIRQQPN